MSRLDEIAEGLRATEPPASQVVVSSPWAQMRANVAYLLALARAGGPMFDVLTFMRQARNDPHFEVMYGRKLMDAIDAALTAYTAAKESPNG